MHTTRIACLAALLAAVATTRPRAQGIVPIPDYTSGNASSWRLREYATGDWGGSRSTLAEQGLTLDLRSYHLTQSILEGPRDGEEALGGRLQLTGNLDLDRMGLVRGGLLTFRAESRYGDSVNAEAGALLPVADLMYFPKTDPAEDTVPLAVTEFLYTQFLSKQVGVFVGKFIVLGGDSNEFAGGDGTTQFVGHPFTSASVTATFNPYATMGGGVFFMPTPELTWSSSLYASRDSSTTAGFDTLDDGLVWSTAVAQQYRIGDRPGGVRATFQYAFDRDFVDLQGQFVLPGSVTLPRTRDSWAAFVNGWQYLAVFDESEQPIRVQDGRADRRGIGVFARLGTADHDTNPIQWTASFGVGGRGLDASRPNDTFGLGYAWSDIGSVPFENLTSRLIAGTAQRLEAYYSFGLTPATDLTFDVQWADSLFARRDSSLLFGVRLGVRF
jgi:porin